jgi:DNA-binding phage protein
MQATTDARPLARDLGTTGEPDAFSMAEAARKSGLSRSVLYEHVTGHRQPRLETIKLGKRRLVTEDARRRWLATLAKG